MSRRLINGDEWRLLTAAIGGGLRRFSSSPRDSRDVLMNYYSEIDGTPSITMDWYQYIENEYKRTEYKQRLWDFLGHSDDDDDDELLDDVFDRCTWDSMHFDELDCSAGYSDGVDVFAASGPVSSHGMVANLFKSGMLPDMNNDTFVIQGGNVHDWEFSGSASTAAGASAGFYSLPSVSSTLLGADVQREEEKWEVCGFASILLLLEYQGDSIVYHLYHLKPWLNLCIIMAV